MDNEAILSATKAVIAVVLKESGFSHVEAPALALLSDTLINYTVYLSYKLKRQAEDAHRNSPALVDAVPLLQWVKDIPETQESLVLAQEPETDPIPVYTSEICTYAEYPANYYDFLPRFPPAHTFKNTPIKRRVSDDRALKARLRNEQITKVVENLFGIMHKKNQPIKRANYLAPTPP
ncbi:hypothetical protein NEHOM01_0947 [Nematocida homosporus]|uniref:uncharacterized protein n=1 Tax=Nematocida homosporus TaxID=1912981 RepID=UPI00221E9FD9|nr:uncharacterized protein NEHOM01_0947 [Nematocida homosporus]KAI5185621.1 hypothetical protein NEHOM01_0947 [Nematocida homosporus]